MENKPTKKQIVRLIQGEIGNRNKVWWVLDAENIKIAKVVVWRGNKNFFDVFPDAESKLTEKEQYEFEISNILSESEELKQLMSYWHTPEQVVDYYLEKSQTTNEHSLWEKTKTPLLYGSIALGLILVGWLSWLRIRNRKKNQTKTKK